MTCGSASEETFRGGAVRPARVEGPPKLPAELQAALHSLYGNYVKSYKRWQEAGLMDSDRATPPVFIVVCNNTNVSKLVFDYIAGFEKGLPDGGTTVVPGALDLFSNATQDGAWSNRPNTILVDSRQLESGESMSDAFKKVAGREIEEFKQEYRIRFPGRDPEELADEDLLREVMNTVGKPGKLGARVRCVVSVSMLTEGWDANTVTHILGVRAFSTQLLCEQVVGRGLRRMSYVPNDDGMFEPEYAEVYGVPFSFIPSAGTNPSPKPPRLVARVRALEDRIDSQITFPRLTGYRYEIADSRLEATFNEDSLLALSTQDVPTKTELRPIVGEITIDNLHDLERRREQEVVFFLAKLVLEKYFGDGDGGVKPWLFPQLLRISKRWIDECVTLKDNTFPQLLLLHEHGHDASDRIYKAITASHSAAPLLRPILHRYEPLGSTRWVDFDTTRTTYTTRRQVPYLPCRRGLGLGGQDGRDARGHGRGRRLRQEPGPRFHHPLYLEWSGAQLHPRLHRADRRRSRRASEPHHRGLRPGQEGQEGQGNHREDAVGFPPSTTTEASDGGTSSRSPIRGMRRAPQGRSSPKQRGSTLR